MQHNDIVKKYPQSMENVLLILHELQKNNFLSFMSCKKTIHKTTLRKKTSFGWLII
jgi:hypothetical protein